MTVTKEIQEQFKALFHKENELRDEFIQKRNELEALIQPITNHVKDCNDWWSKHFGDDVSEIIFIINYQGKKKGVRVLKPVKEVATIETYLPYGIDYADAIVFNCE